jgi:hypothetical protein
MIYKFTTFKELEILNSFVNLWQCNTYKTSNKLGQILSENF